MNGWKVAAIIFIVLFILETIFLGLMFQIGTDVTNKEAECADVICRTTDSFTYNSNTEICYCYEQGELAFSQSMKHNA